MKVVGRLNGDGSLKIDGMFINESLVVEIEADTPPNPPEYQLGKDNEIQLNLETNELYWLAVDRPLTDAEKVIVLENQNADLIYQLMMKGVL